MFSIKKYPLLAVSVLITDICMILFSFFIAYYIRFSGVLIPADKGTPSLEAYFRAMFVVIPVYLLMFRTYQLYRPERHVRRIYELFNMVKATTMATIFLMAVTFVYREFSYSRFVFIFSWGISILLCGIGRYFLIQLEYFIRREKEQDRVLIVGINQNASNLIKWTKTNPHYGQKIVGLLSNNDGGDQKNFENVSVLGTINDLDEIIEKEHIDEVIVTDSGLSKDMVGNLMMKCESKMIDFKFAADFYGLITKHVDVEYISNVPLIGIKGLPLDDIWNRGLKRVFDIIVSSFALFLLSPLFLLIAVLNKLSNPGPIFYGQKRIGRDGRQFKIYKFRTMIANAEKATGPVWAKPNDDRVTLLGRFLRKFNLDELPQLLNVLTGEMSLVGPRPERPHFVEQFRDQIPRYMARHKIKSGLTGWAQIHGLRGDTSIEERIKYDLYYMENWTLMMDVEILFATIFAYKNAY